MPFQKGQSGNPSGRPKLDKEITELARKEAPEAFQRIVDLSGDESVSAKIRLSANQYIVDRACGKPAQAVTGEGGTGPIDVNLSGNQLAVQVAAILRGAVEGK